eukprot:3169338-Pyramimonas_sp.AAC.1
MGQAQATVDQAMRDIAPFRCVLGTPTRRHVTKCCMSAQLHGRACQGAGFSDVAELTIAFGLSATQTSSSMWTRFKGSCFGARDPGRLRACMWGDTMIAPSVAE